MTNTLKLSTLATMAAASALLLVGCSSPSTEAPPVKDSVEEVEPTTPTAEAVEEEAEEEVVQPEASPEGYQAIYDEYSARLTEECQVLSMTECAELSNEGVSKMAEYMFKAKGTEGQMATYEEWAGKLMDVYMSSVQ
ncbi:hypothetical protein [Leucobacter komagatae]|uniref:Lipoprotein n=1 Tax=Leucobacter komagatae TaxID=55969 RepID=A0A0D0IQP5_9MICO|nr:hypothetical protein [Leucobacter komagatae]KIP53347.1 hypothetical protein SD72_03690 [Leucobacter komagatae]